MTCRRAFFGFVHADKRIQYPICRWSAHLQLTRSQRPAIEIGETMGQVFKHNLWYGPAEQERTLHVYLPNGYEDSDERYPVMYFFDGHNLFSDQDATFGTSWGLKDFLDSWEKPLIVVGMECSHEGESRLDEYCPYPCHQFGHDILGLGEQTFQWIINDVKAWADANLRTWWHREATGLGGSSMGGLMSLYGVMAHNDVFSKAACLSPAMRLWNPQLRQELAGAKIAKDTKVYLSFGEFEAGHTRKSADPATESPEARALRLFVHHLERTGASAYCYCQPNGYHNEASWGQQNGRFLDFLWLNRRW